MSNVSNNCEKFQIALLPSMYGVEFCVALAGNLYALWLLVVKERRNWHTGAVLSCNLVISDLLYMLTLPLLIVYYSLEKHWIFGNAVCKIEKFLFTCNLYVSIFFIMWISVYRCLTITSPYFTGHWGGPACAKAVSVAIWILVGVISCPALKYASVCPSKHNMNKTLCVSYCESHDDASSFFTYKVFLAVFGCLVPFVVTFASYCVVIWVVWKKANITTLIKWRIALLIISVIVLYAFSFGPYHVFQNYYFYLRTKHPDPFICWVFYSYQISKGLATLNMCIHPILYMAMFDSIRVACCGKRLEENKREGTAY